MDGNAKYKYFLRRERERENSNPSFSSTLLDAIYRSIDEGNDDDDDKIVVYKETMRKKQSSNFRGGADFERSCMLEKLMEKKISEKVVVRRKSAPDCDRKISRNDKDFLFFNSSSSSSDSSSGGFTSSEPESGVSSQSSCYRLPKKIHSTANTEKFAKKAYDETNPKQEGMFLRTNIHGDLKKVKQPISPGARVASFLNSIFASGNAKKAKITSDEMGSERNSKSGNASASRSCLSSRGKKSSDGMKRSVRFYPVSVILDEDCQPCGEKNLYDDEVEKMMRSNSRNVINEELKIIVMEKNRKVGEAARELLLRNFQTRVERNFDWRGYNFKNQADDDEEEDDAASYASSDLFELDNLAGIGNDMDELPVYESTRLDTSGLIL